MDTYKAPSTHTDREFLKTESFFSSLGYVHSASDSFCAVMKIIPDSSHKNGCGGAISVTERSCVLPISKVEVHISDRFCAILWRKVNTYSARRGSK